MFIEMMRFLPRSVAAALAGVMVVCGPVSAAEPGDFKDWRILCREDGAGCRMAQTVVQPSTGRTIVLARIMPSDPPTALITFPLGILLSTGWEYRIDGGPVTRLPFELCNHDGCHVGLKLTSTLLGAFRRGAALKLTFWDAEKTKVELDISLAGFTDGYVALQR